MIRAIIFDLDGTLVQSEELKANSYAIAAQKWLGLPEPAGEAIDAYREIVGATREVASRHIAEKLKLGAPPAHLREQFGGSETWEVLTNMRKEIYNEMVSDPQVLQANQWPHTIGLLRLARQTRCYTALATMSYRAETLHVLDALGLADYLDVVLTREDVKNPKPDPEIYLLASQKLGVPPGECIVVEDSVTGVRAAVAAGANVIAVATPFTSVGLHENEVIDHAWIVHDPATIMDMVKRRMEEHDRSARTGS